MWPDCVGLKVTGKPLSRASQSRASATHDPAAIYNNVIKFTRPDRLIKFFLTFIRIYDSSYFVRTFNECLLNVFKTSWETLCLRTSIEVYLFLNCSASPWSWSKLCYLWEISETLDACIYWLNRIHVKFVIEKYNIAVKRLQTVFCNTRFTTMSNGNSQNNNSGV